MRQEAQGLGLQTLGPPVGAVDPGSVALGKLPTPLCMFLWLQNRDKHSACWRRCEIGGECSPEVPVNVGMH